MRNNSLRQTNIWQQRHTHKINHTVQQFNKKQNKTNREPLKDIVKYSNNCDQHSELKWLEKVVKDMQEYHEGKNDESNKDEIEVNQKIEKEVQVKKISGREKSHIQSKMSARKIKFQVINKENKLPSQRKKTLPSKPNKSKDTKTVNKKYSYPLNQQSSSNTNIVETANYMSHNVSLKMEPLIIENSQTDPCNFDITYNSRDQSLWKVGAQMDDVSKPELNRSCQSRRSIGKIVKNSLSKAVIQPSSEKKIFIVEKKCQIEPPTSAKKNPKVYIKLVTQNLSKYLGQSTLKQPSPQKLIKVEEYEKVCQTKRASSVHPRRYESNYLPARERIQVGKTEKIWRRPKEEKSSRSKIECGHNQSSLNSARSVKDKKSSRQSKIDNICEKFKPSERVKSQQRKLNKSVCLSKQSKGVQKCERNVYLQRNQTEQTQNQFLSIVPNPSVVPSKSHYVGQEQRLQSQPSKQIEQQQLKAIQKGQILISFESECNKKDEEIDESFKLSEDSVAQETVEPEKNEIKHKQIEQLVCQSIKLPEQERPILNKPEIVQSHLQSYQNELIQLYKYLDQGRRNLLTSSNCQLEGLTQEVKILFSSIFHQIKAKKRAYSLQKFIRQCQDVIKIKQEVYTKASPTISQLSSLLKTNNQLCKQKSMNTPVPRPARAIPVIQEIESRQSTQRQTQRTRSVDNQSIVLSKMVLKPYEQEPISQIRRFNPRPALQQINLAEPQLYFQKKYGLEAFNNGKENTRPEHSRGSYRYQQ